MIKKYRKRPVTIKAVKWDGTVDAYNAVSSLGGQEKVCVNSDNELELQGSKPGDDAVMVDLGDYVIQEVDGGLVPCQSVFFEKTYEEVGE